MTRTRWIFLTAGLVLVHPVAAPASEPGRIAWKDALRQSPAWYGTDEAVRTADAVLLHQRDCGGWPKNVDMAAPLDAGAKARLLRDRSKDDATIDNGATWTQLRFLARVVAATGEARFRDSFLRGLDALLAAQYENGGFPQSFPRPTGYHAHVTFNDGAMVGVLELLRDVGRGGGRRSLAVSPGIEREGTRDRAPPEGAADRGRALEGGGPSPPPGGAREGTRDRAPPAGGGARGEGAGRFAPPGIEREGTRDRAHPDGIGGVTHPDLSFVDEARRARCAAAVEKGVECILRCQIVVGGRRTVWCAQHDARSLAPAPARTYEKASFSGGESVGVVRFLMGIERPEPRVVEAVEGAVAWLDGARIVGIRVEERSDPSQPGGRDKVVVDDPKAPPIWARFYELGTGRPIFCGRDGVVKYCLSEIEHERRVGYAWYVDEPRALLEKEYPAWAARWTPGRDVRGRVKEERAGVR